MGKDQVRNRKEKGGRGCRASGHGEQGSRVETRKGNKPSVWFPPKTSTLQTAQPSSPRLPSWKTPKEAPPHRPDATPSSQSRPHDQFPVPQAGLPRFCYPTPHPRPLQEVTKAAGPLLSQPPKLSQLKSPFQAPDPEMKIPDPLGHLGLGVQCVSHPAQ